MRMERNRSRRDQARLFGVLGSPVDHSLSPAMHNAAFAAARLPHLYLRFHVPVEELPAALAEARRLRMGGVNLTVPLKEAVLPLLDRLTTRAERAGAVNTIVFRADGAIGDNTDGDGFLRALRGRVRIPGRHTVLIGAGGSAQAVGVALATAGARRITVVNRTPARGEALASRLAAAGCPEVNVLTLDALRQGLVLADAALVVNTTPVGLGGTPLPIRHAASPAGCLFVDLVYGSRPTPFLAGAVRARRPAMDGAGMLLHQGALAFEAWTGRRPSLVAMARALAAHGLTLTQLGRTSRVPRRRPPMP